MRTRIRNRASGFRIGLFLAGLLLLAAASPANAQQPVVVGAGTTEWDARTPAYEDASDDAPTGSAELIRLWAGSDDAYLYLAFEVAEPLLLSRENDVRLVLDADADTATGQPVQGLGAELVWRFGDLRGDVYTEAFEGQARGAEVGLLTAPQVTATRFELALPRREVAHVVPLLRGDSVRVALLGSSTGDVLPDAPGGVLVELSDMPHVRPPVTLEKEDSTHVRVLAYNVLRDRLFDPTYEAGYQRVLQALRPDVVIAVEVYDHGGDQTAARVAALLDEPVEAWHGAKAGPDVVVAARSPVTVLAAVAGNGVFTVERPGGAARDWLVVGMHPPCCTSDAGRQVEVDAMIAYLRDAHESGTVPEGTPIVVGGDMNFVGDVRQRQTLLTGDIVDEERFGPDFAPGGEGAPLIDALPRTTGLPAAFTWRNVRSAFPPGRLDYVVYGGASLAQRRAFVLYTPGMTSDEREAYGLEEYDAAGLGYGFDGEPYPSDHLPLVVDLHETADVAAERPAAVPSGVRILSFAPHPLRDLGILRYRLGSAGHVEVALFDVLGRRVRLLEDTYRAAGDHTLAVDAAALAPGLYVLCVTSAGAVHTRRLAIVR